MFNRKEYTKKWYLKNKDKVLMGDKKYYDEHREERVARAKAWRMKHYDKSKEYYKKYYLKNKEKLLADKKIYYKNNKERYKKYNQDNRELKLIYSREYYTNNKEVLLSKRKIAAAKLKCEVLAHYSVGNVLKCSMCNVTDIDMLCIDHVEGGGNKHRRKIDIIGGGDHFYRWLKNQGFPDGYQTLCYNHNRKKEIEERGS